MNVAREDARWGVVLDVQGRRVIEQRYLKRREREIEPDAVLGWTCAAAAEIATWSESNLLASYRAARAGRRIPAWPTLAPWARVILGRHLDSRIELAQREDAVVVGAELFHNDFMMRELVRDPPVPAITGLFAAYAKRIGGGGDAVVRPTEVIEQSEAATLQVFVSMLAGEEVSVEHGDVDAETRTAMYALVSQWVPRVPTIKTKHAAHRPKKQVPRAFFDGVTQHFMAQGYAAPTATDLHDLGAWCEIEEASLKTWDRRLAEYRNEFAE